MDYTIHLPSKPKVVKEEGSVGVFEIEGLYPGYGHTLGNSLRRIILSSLYGSAITGVKLTGVGHEFSTLEGVKEDVVAILLNLKQVRLRIATGEPQRLSLSIKGPKTITAGDIEVPGQVEILNKDQVIATVTGKVSFEAEFTAETGLGYVPKEIIQKDRLDAGMIALDGAFSPIERVNYEVEDMRVEDRTDFNKLIISITTDGSLTPKEALENAITIMVKQLKAIVGFQEDELELSEDITKVMMGDMSEDEMSEVTHDDETTEDEKKEFLKTRIESLGFSTRTENALSSANIRTVGGLVRKSEEDLLALDGFGDKGLQEVKRVLGNYGIILK